MRTRNPHLRQEKTQGPTERLACPRLLGFSVPTLGMNSAQPRLSDHPVSISLSHLACLSPLLANAVSPAGCFHDAGQAIPFVRRLANVL